MYSPAVRCQNRNRSIASGQMPPSLPRPGLLRCNRSGRTERSFRLPAAQAQGEPDRLSRRTSASRSTGPLSTDRRCLVFARNLVAAKIRNARIFLRRNFKAGDEAAREETLAALSRFAERALYAPTESELLGIEGEAAARTRRPPVDPVNACSRSAVRSAGATSGAPSRRRNRFISSLSRQVIITVEERLYIVTHDISDDRRWRRMCIACAQRSVSSAQSWPDGRHVADGHSRLKERSGSGCVALADDLAEAQKPSDRPCADPLIVLLLLRQSII